jgi:uncharacterized membrane protein
LEPNKVQKITPRDTARKSRKGHVVAVSQQFSGPIPPPNVLHAYNSIIPNAAERILNMAEKEQNFRHEMTQVQIKANVKNIFLGQIFGFTIALFGLAGSVWVAIQGHPWSSSLISGITLFWLVGLFVTGKEKKMETKNTEEKEIE